MDQPLPRIAQRGPIAIDVEPGKTYWWCACGQSKSQPFCDGSHKGGPFSPKAFTAERAEQVYFCACKHTGNGVRCDGTHHRV